MKEFRDIMVIIALAAIPTSGFLSTAFLIYHSKPGWGWLLFVVFIISASIKMSIKN
ncbi:hypothetical protein [Arsenophonus nasoniae]|uniref:Uncharacterized protein n=1 Tax=Arsenophonus nasoniae TaxID=638 RepID=A0AA95GKY2_9GAMM|nr:hypothetical protein [Arsenophonus nasoniae]WGM00903.1 hypothetical protein QE210_13755 [Arsenophonus nasoniae]